MSGIEINKIVGAILSAALVITVINFIGDALVSPKQQTAAAVIVASAPAAATMAKPEKDPPIAQLLASATTASGKKAFKKCQSCHNAAEGAKNKIGPNLWDVVGNKKAAAAGFKYSGALTGLGGSWSYEDLDAFLKNPRKFAKGTKMTFSGVKKAGDRAALITYLRSLSPAPKPLP